MYIWSHPPYSWEIVATMDVLDEVVQKGKHTIFNHSQMLCDPLLYTGFKVEEVAHDCNVGLTKKIIEKGYINSHDTWHGMFLTPLI